MTAEMTAEVVPLPNTSRRPIDQDAGWIELWVHEALEHIDPSNLDNRETVGRALRWAEVNNGMVDACAVWDAWASRCPIYQSKDGAKEWERFRPSYIHKLTDLAEQAGWPVPEVAYHRKAVDLINSSDFEGAKWLARELTVDGVQPIFDHKATDQPWVYSPKGFWRPIETGPLIRMIGFRRFTHKVATKDKDGDITFTPKPFQTGLRWAQRVVDSMRHFQTKAEFFDKAAPGVLFSNGFLDSRNADSLKLRVPAPEDRIKEMYRFGFDFNMQATSPIFEEYLEGIWGSEPDYREVRSSLLQFIAAAILGEATTHHRMLFIKGSPGTGKSTLVEVIEGFFPDASISHVEPQSLGHEVADMQWRSNHQLMNKLLNSVSELPNKPIMDSKALNRVAGGEAITARAMGKDLKNFRPRAAHVYACNNLPQVPGAASDFFDRALILDFPNTPIRGTSKEVFGFAAEILKDTPALVATALREAGQLKGGMLIPTRSKRLAKKWQGGVDAVAEWVTEFHVEGYEHKLDNYTDYPQWTAVWRHLKAWADDNEFKSGSSKTARERLEAHGMRKEKSGGVHYLVGCVVPELLPPTSRAKLPELTDDD